MNEIEGILEGRVEPFLLNKIPDLSHVTVEDGVEMHLTHNRFDVAFKLYYLQGLKGPSSSFRKKCYEGHIKAFSLGSFSEPGNPEKNSIENFELDFKSVFKDLEATGFDARKSVIPLAEDGSILNGA